MSKALTRRNAEIGQPAQIFEARVVGRDLSPENYNFAELLRDRDTWRRMYLECRDERNRMDGIAVRAAGALRCALNENERLKEEIERLKARQAPLDDLAKLLESNDLRLIGTK